MNFLQKVALEVIAQHGNNLSTIHVVLPTHRACYFFRKALLESGKTLWLPSINTLSDWVQKVAGLQTVDMLEEIMLLHSIYLQTGRGETLDEFLPLGRTLCNDFEEIDMHMVRIDWFFRELRNLASMKVYEPATELSASQLDYLKFWERFEVLYKTHRKELKTLGKANAGMIFRQVAENIEAISKDLSNFYFVGFDGLTKAEETIIRHMHTHAKATVFWNTDAYYVENTEREAGYFFRKYFKEWKGNMQYCENQILTTKKEVEVISVARSVGQAKVAVEIIANHLQLTDANAINTAVILSDEKLLQPLQYLLPSSLSKYNLTMGLPVLRSLAGEFFLLLFKLHDTTERIMTRTHKQKLYFKDVVALFQHSFFGALVPQAEIHAAIAAIRRKNIVFVDRSYFEKNHAGFPAQVLEVLFHTSHSDKYLQQLMLLAEQLIEHFKQAGKSEMELEFLHKISDAIGTIAKPLANVVLQTKTIRALLNDEFKAHRVPFEGEPAEGLQIMGLMESRCLDFENIIVLSANEGVLPSGKGSKSYIPHPLRNAALFSHVQKDARTAYLFYRLFHKAKRIYLLYDTEGNSLGGGEKSRFLLQLGYELVKETSSIKLKESVYSVSPPAATAAAAISVPKTEAVLQTIKSNMAYGLSPSGLSTFINCPLQYYFRYIAHIQEADDVEESMESNTIGTAIHHVLEVLYKPKVGAVLTVDWLEQISKNSAEIERLLKEGFREKFDEDALMQGKNHLQYRLSLKMIDAFLKNEIARVKQGESIRIEALETPLETVFNVHDSTVKIKGFADRIEFQGKALTIVDFKSGKAKNVSLKGDEQEVMFKDPKFKVQFQLLMYAWTYWRMNATLSLPIQSGIFWLQRVNKGFDKLDINDTTLLGVEHLQFFEEQLLILLKELLNAEIPFMQTAEVERCTYCAYKRICKR